MSFKGANPDIEKLMKKLDYERNPLVPKEDQVLINDREADFGAEQVAQQYSLTKRIRHQTFANRRGHLSPRQGDRRHALKRRAQD